MLSSVLMGLALGLAVYLAGIAGTKQLPRHEGGSCAGPNTGYAVAVLSWAWFIGPIISIALAVAAGFAAHRLAWSHLSPAFWGWTLVFAVLTFLTTSYSNGWHWRRRA